MVLLRYYSHVKHTCTNICSHSLIYNLFASYMACSLRDNKNSHYILTLLKAALRLITFSAALSNLIFSNLRILKFFDIVEVLNILFVHQYLNENLPCNLLKTLKFNKISHSFKARGLLFLSVKITKE